MKNWLPPVFGPAFAMLNMPGLLWCSAGFSSSGMEKPGPPVPSPRGSPPWIMKSGMTRWKIKPS